MNTINYLSSAYNSRYTKVLDSVADPIDLVDTWAQAVRSINYLDPETERAVKSAYDAVRTRDPKSQRPSEVWEPFSRTVEGNLRIFQYAAKEEKDSDEQRRIRRARNLTHQLKSERGWRLNGIE